MIQLEEALDLIKRQQAEIERLNHKIAEYPHRVLCSKGLILTKSFEDYDELINDIASEAIKEFADRLKKKMKTPTGTFYGRNVYDSENKCINNLVKEMTGDK